MHISNKRYAYMRIFRPLLSLLTGIKRFSHNLLMERKSDCRMPRSIIAFSSNQQSSAQNTFRFNVYVKNRRDRELKPVVHRKNSTHGVITFIYMKFNEMKHPFHERLTYRHKQSGKISIGWTVCQDLILLQFIQFVKKRRREINSDFAK